LSVELQGITMMADAASLDEGLESIPVEATAEADRAAGLTETSSSRITTLSVLSGYCLAVTFQDGTHGDVNLSPRLMAYDCGVSEE
jgi:hypothetical protein